MGGKNENNFIIEAYSGNYGDTTYFINWNGNKWSKELRIIRGLISKIHKVSENYYFTIFDHPRLYFYTGRPKN